jgi:hypothetical protein
VNQLLAPHTSEKHPLFPPSLNAPHQFFLAFRAAVLENFWVMSKPNVEEQQDSQKKEWHIQT